MIRIVRTEKPVELTEAIEKQLTEEFIANNSRKVWDKRYIRSALLNMSNNKCCYCECLVGSGHIDMHIEHFYPKSIYPNLVVDWNNLLPSCAACNSFKGSHDTRIEPIINPTLNRPQDYFYLRDYRYKCKSNNINSIARRTLEVLMLNDTEKRVKQRFILGETLNDEIEKAREYLEDNYTDIAIAQRIKNRGVNWCKKILRFGVPTAEFSAFMATIIYNNEDYCRIKEILNENNLWCEELRQLEESLLSNVYDIQ